MKGGERWRRRSIRLPCYDYAAAGAYFVTIVTQDRAPILGTVVNGRAKCTVAGRMVWEVWSALPSVHPCVQVDTFVVMPDHVHGILVLAPRVMSDDEALEVMSLPTIVGLFKSMTTKRYIEGVNAHGWPSFRVRLWQRNYYERIVRDDDALDRIRRYILANPARWRR